jgi:large subunit ribosomal protein L10
MSKPVKNLVSQSYLRRFGDLSGAVVVDIRGIEANDNNRMRHDLAQKNIKITVVKNSLARSVFKDTDLAQISEVIDGPSAMVYPVDEDVSVVSIARELIQWAKDLKKMDFRGALMEGIVFGPGEINALSKYPTREEAHAQAVQIILSPGQNLVGAILGPGRKIASIIKAIEEKLEQGETIAKAG